MLLLAGSALGQTNIGPVSAPEFRNLGPGLCDGTTDDSAVYQAQMTSLAGTAGRSVVPTAKTCAIASPLQMYAQANLVSQDRAGGSFGEGGTTTGLGATLKWTGANSQVFLHFFDAMFSSVQGITLDAGSATGATGIWANSDNNPGADYNLFRDIGLKGFSTSFAIGRNDTTVISPATCAGNNAQAGCSQTDSWRLSRFQIYGGGASKPIGIQVNTANSTPSMIEWGNIQGANVSIQLLRHNSPVSIQHVNAGSFAAGAPAINPAIGFPVQFYFGPSSEGAYMQDDECESGFVGGGSSGTVNHYAFYDESTFQPTYYMLGNQWFCPGIIAGNSKVVSIANSGFTNGTLQQTGSASYVLSLGDHALWSHSAGVFDYIDATGWQSQNGMGVGSNGPSANAAYSVSGFLAGGSTAPRAYVDVNQYTNCSTSCISFYAGPITQAAGSNGFGHFVADPAVSGVGAWTNYTAFYSQVTAGAGKSFLTNAGGAFSDFGTGIVAGSGNWNLTGKVCVGAVCNGAMNPGDVQFSTSSTTGDVFLGTDTFGIIRRYSATGFRFQGNGGTTICWGACGSGDFQIKDDGTGIAKFRNFGDSADAPIQAGAYNGSGPITGTSHAGTGTATFAAGAAAGTSPGTPTCTTSHVCDSHSGTISFTMGTATNTGIALTVTTSVTRTNQPNCVGAMYLVASPFTAIPLRLTETTTTVVFNVGLAPTVSTAYELTYLCGGN